MEFQEFVPSVPYVASVLVVGVFLWRVFVRMLAGMEARFDDRFGQIDRQFGQIDRQFAQMDNRFEHMDNRIASLEIRFDDRFKEMHGRFASLEKKVDGLADDHHGLSRELSEFRGEMRGRLSMLVPQAAAGEA